MKSRLGMLLAIAIALPVMFALPIPGFATSQIFLFASPNRHESVTDRSAKLRLSTFEQINAIAVADRAACALTDDAQITSSLGVYDNSSENSFIVEARLDQKQGEYLAALLGLYLRQEFILLFLPDLGGGDRLWIVKTPQTLEEVVARVRQRKLTPVTVRTENYGNEIWFFDIGDKLASELKVFASDVNGQASITEGRAEMLGNRRRATAVQGWRQRIRTFERQSGGHLSERLSSKAWHAATVVHTCTTEAFGRK